MATVSSRSRGCNCPVCAVSICSNKIIDRNNPKVGFSENSRLINEWSEKNYNLNPNEIKCNSKKIVWWKCSKCGFEWEATVKSRYNGSKCPKCRNKEKGEKTVIRQIQKNGSLLSKNPELSKEWHPTKNGDLTPDDITANSNKKIWWVCRKGHEWEATVASRNAGGGCPYCNNRKLLVGFNDLLTVNPDLSQEWNYDMNNGLKPCDVFPNSSKKVWWHCKVCGYDWQAQVHNRNRGHGCPVCSAKNK
jgi:predicted Zn-ribbon and HTH transcriptional regulator